MPEVAPPAVLATPEASVRPVPLPPGLTIYLDVVRVVAAVAVWMSHYLPLFGIGHDAPPYGHDAVVVFFVISGLVVALVCDTRRRGLGEFALSRVVRLWSVAVPALLIGLCLQAVAADGGDWPRAVRATGLNLVFLGESWAGSVGAPFNPPYWSLNYEAWFYACYGCAVFLSGRMRAVAVAGMVAAAGPAILALAPCWLAGVAVYRWRGRLRLSPVLAAVVFAGSLVAGLAIDVMGFEDWSRDWLHRITAGQSYHLGASQALLSDYVLTAVVVANFVAAGSLPGLGRVLARVRRPVGWAASLTLSLYLFHMPVLWVIRTAAGPTSLQNGWGLPATIGVAGVAIVLLGQVTELQRYRLKRLLLAGWRPRIGAA